MLPTNKKANRETKCSLLKLAQFFTLWQTIVSSREYKVNRGDRDGEGERESERERTCTYIYKE